jgi:hypothetical protein
VRRKPQHRSLLTVASATSAPPSQPFRHQRNVWYQGGFLADQTDGNHWGRSLGCGADVQEVPTVVLEFSRGLLGLYGSGIFMIGSTALASWPVRFLRVASRTITFPVHGVTLNFLAEGELGCFHCTETRFDSGW